MPQQGKPDWAIGKGWKKPADEWLWVVESGKAESQ